MPSRSILWINAPRERNKRPDSEMGQDSEHTVIWVTQALQDGTDEARRLVFLVIHLFGGDDGVNR